MHCHHLPADAPAPLPQGRSELDRISSYRESWVFTYTGTQLLPYAVGRKRVFAANCRLISERVRVALPEEWTALKRELLSLDRELKALEAWCHEFARDPEREYPLSLADVQYFEIPQLFPRLSKYGHGSYASPGSPEGCLDTVHRTRMDTLYPA